MKAESAAEFISLLQRGGNAFEALEPAAKFTGVHNSKSSKNPFRAQITYSTVPGDLTTTVRKALGSFATRNEAALEVDKARLGMSHRNFSL